MHEVLFQQFARYPEPGAVKTRLARSLGAETACAVHEELMAVTATTLRAAGLGPVELWLDRCRDHPVLADIIRGGARGPYVQRGCDLGARMYNAVVDGRRRARTVILVGSDCPGVDATYLREAVQALRDHDVVLGPAEDGGYVLMATRRPSYRLFDGIQWGTERVLSQTLTAAAAAGLSVSRLAPRYDIDDEADYRRWRAETAALGAGGEGA